MSYTIHHTFVYVETLNNAIIHHKPFFCLSNTFDLYIISYPQKVTSTSTQRYMGKNNMLACLKCAVRQLFVYYCLHISSDTCIRYKFRLEIPFWVFFWANFLKNVNKPPAQNLDFDYVFQK